MGSAAALRRIRLAVPSCAPLAALILSLLLVGCRDERTAGKAAGRGEYACRFDTRTTTTQAWEGEPVSLKIRVTNTGKKEWSSSGSAPVRLSYHLRDARRRMIRSENSRFVLPHPMPSGSSAELAVEVKAPLEKGRYRLEFDMVREGRAWFKDYGSRTKELTLIVRSRPWPEEKQDWTLEAGEFTGVRSVRREFSPLLKLIRITLNRNDLTFDGRTGRVSGFWAGAGYPQFWLRDALSILPASRWYYGAAHLTSWLEEHLACQKESGSLYDWIDSQGGMDKNSVETDQEASAVQAACQVAGLVGAEWLNKDIRQRSILERLEAALQYVLEARFDAGLGLITGAHTIDWGDVEDVDDDHQAVYADERSYWTADIYDQAMFYRAAMDLAGMLERAGMRERSMFWTVQAQSVRKNADARLWQPERGFYRVHVHLDPAHVHDFPEDELFAMGGNVTAVLGGLADETQCSLILQKALELQAAFRLPTISGVLLPPYPPGVFKHPAVDMPYEYQNGGLWDWFGGRLVYALFENGFSRAARVKLKEIALKNRAGGGLSEWDDRRGRPRGSDFFSGSAGSLGLALFQGYYGLKMSRDSLSLEPKLAGDSARVHAYLPAAGLFLAYDHRVLADGKTLLLDFNSNFPGTGTVKVLLPWMYIAGESREVSPEELTVTLDGRPVEFRKTRVLQDEFIIIRTDFKDHRLKIRHR